MKIKEYQDKAMETCMPSCENISYMLLNLVGEVGELAGKIAKGIRKGEMVIGFSEAMDEAKESDLIPQMNFFEWTSVQDDLMHVMHMVGCVSLIWICILSGSLSHSPVP